MARGMGITRLSDSAEYLERRDTRNRAWFGSTLLSHGWVSPTAEAPGVGFSWPGNKRFAAGFIVTIDTDEREITVTSDPQNLTYLARDFTGYQSHICNPLAYFSMNGETVDMDGPGDTYTITHVKNTEAYQAAYRFYHDGNDPVTYQSYKALPDLLVEVELAELGGTLQAAPSQASGGSGGTSASSDNPAATAFAAAVGAIVGTDHPETPVETAAAESGGTG